MKGFYSKIFIIALIIGIQACSGDEKEKGKSDKHGGTLFVETNVPVDKSYVLKPRHVGESSYQYIILNEFEGLTRIEPATCKLEPQLAKSWEILNEGQIFIFHLRNNIFFSHKTDEKPFSAYDVKNCFDSLCQNDLNVAYSKVKDVVLGMEEFKESIVNNKPLKNGISGITILNDSTIRFELLKKYVPFPQLLSDPSLTIYRTTNTNFYGTGPFVFDTIIDNKLCYQRNESYWKKDSDGYRLPYLDKLVIVSSVIKNNENGSSRSQVTLTDRLTLFLKDSLNIIRSINANDIDTVMKVLREVNNKDFDYESIDYARLNAIALNNYAKPFNDYRVRKAFELAFDAELFVDSVLNGEGWPANYGIMPPSLVPYADTVVNRTYDLKKAKELLAEAGYSDLNNFPTITLSAVYYNGSDKSQTEIFNSAVKMICKNLGVKYQEKRFENYRRLFDNNYTGDFMMSPFSYTTKIVSPVGYLHIFAIKIDTNSKTEHDNIMFFRDSIFDEYYIDALKQVNDEKRFSLFLKAEQEIHRKTPIIPLFYTEYNRIVNKKVQGLSPINNLGLEDFTYTYFKK